MTRQQLSIAEAFQHRTYFGGGMGATQQQAADTVGSALLNASKLATAIGGPLAGGIVAAAGGIADIVGLFGPNPDNTYATEVVNQVEADGLKPNLAAWQAIPDSQKTEALQQAAEAVFTAGWNYVLAACNNVSLGSAGINCIADRQRGGKFDWWAAYYDPIANDPNPAANAATAAAQVTTTASDGTTGTATSTGTVSIGGLSLSPEILIGIGIIALAFMVGD